MAVVELRDRAAIAAVCRRKPSVHVYELGDLDDFFWPHTRWFGLGRRRRASQQVALAVHGARAAGPDRASPTSRGRRWQHLLASVAPATAARTSTRTGRRPARRARRSLRAKHAGASPEDGACRARTARWSRHTVSPPSGPRSADEVEDVLRRGLPGHVVRAADARDRPLRRYPRRASGSPASPACTSTRPRWRVAALGNVATLPGCPRPRAWPERACAALCRLLLDDGIETIALNVRSDNAPAIAGVRAARLRGGRGVRRGRPHRTDAWRSAMPEVVGTRE